MKSMNKQPLTIVRFYASPEDNDGSLKSKELRIEPRIKHSTIRGYTMIIKIL